MTGPLWRVVCAKAAMRGTNVDGASRYATKQDRERLRYEVSRRREVRSSGTPDRMSGGSNAGANIRALQRMLGHKSAAMSIDTYADLFDEGLTVVASAVSATRELDLAA